MNNSSSFSQYFPPSSGSSPIELTYTAAQALVSGNTVQKGQAYLITDKADLGLYLIGEDVNHFSIEGQGGYLVANFQNLGANYSGVVGITGINPTDQRGIWNVQLETITITYDTLAGGTFAIGDTITEPTNGAIGTVITDGGGTMTLIKTTPANFFVAGNSINNGMGVSANEVTVGTPTNVTGNMVIWNNQHYQVIDDTLMDGTNPATNTAAYTVCPKTVANTGYLTEWDIVIFDFTNGVEAWRQDKRNNKINNGSLGTWDWGNDTSKNYRQETYNCTVNGLNNRGGIEGRQIGDGSTVTINNNGFRNVIFIDITSVNGVINCPNNTGTLELHVSGFSSGAQGSNNSGDVKLYINDQSLVSFNNNSGDIYGRYADGANRNYDNNTDDIEFEDCTNGANGSWALSNRFGGKGGAKSKYLQNRGWDTGLVFGAIPGWASVKDDENLPKGQFVFINNFGSTPTPTDLGIRIFCETKNRFALRASGGFLNPDYQGVGDYSGVEDVTGHAYDSTFGIWQAIKENDGIGINIVVIWNGLHYQVIDDGAFDGTAPDINTTAYQVLSKSALNVGYIEEWDAIEYDFDNNWIQSREDKRGNKVGATYANANGNLGTDPIPLFQWGRDGNSMGNMVKEGVLNNLNATGAVQINKVELNSKVDCSTLAGNFQSNIVTKDSNITALLNSGKSIGDCEFESASATLDPAISYQGKTLSPHLSTFDAVIEGSTGIDGGGTLTIPDYIGICTITSSNASETIVDFSTAPTFERVFNFSNADTLTSLIFNNSSSLKFPTPSTGTTLAVSLLDFIKFKFDGNSLFIQTASEQY